MWNKHPKALPFLFLSEMWERFGYYLMIGIFTLYLKDVEAGFAMTEKEASDLYGTFIALVFLTPFIGGLVADRYLGYRKSIIIGGILMGIGYFLMGVHSITVLYIAMTLVILGNGFFKPNISTMVGKLYKKGDNRTDAGFSLFYAGINLGALLGGYLCIAIGKGQLFADSIDEAHRWNVAFGLAAFVMCISLINFIFTKRHLGPIGLQPMQTNANGEQTKMPLWKEVGTYILTFAMVPVIVFMIDNTEYTAYFMYTVGPLALIYLFYEMRKLTSGERKKIIAALVFIFFSILFFAIYEQAGGSLSIFAAQNLNSELLGMHLDPNGVNNSGGAFFIIFIAPILGLLWIWMAKKKIEPNTVMKFGIGFILLGAGFYALFGTRFFADAAGMTSLDFFTFALLIITLGELCLSPIGLSIMTKLSTANLQGMMMGMWFLASAYGQYVAGIIGASMSTQEVENPTNYDLLITYTDGYKELGLYAVIAGVILIAFSPVMKKLMQDVK